MNEIWVGVEGGWSTEALAMSGVASSTGGGGDSGLSDLATLSCSKILLIHHFSIF